MTVVKVDCQSQNLIPLQIFWLYSPIAELSIDRLISESKLVDQNTGEGVTIVKVRGIWGYWINALVSVEVTILRQLTNAVTHTTYFHTFIHIHVHICIHAQMHTSYTHMHIQIFITCSAYDIHVL